MYNNVSFTGDFLKSPISPSNTTITNGRFKYYSLRYIQIRLLNPLYSRSVAGPIPLPPPPSFFYADFILSTATPFIFSVDCRTSLKLDLNYSSFFLYTDYPTPPANYTSFLGVVMSENCLFNCFFKKSAAALNFTSVILSVLSSTPLKSSFLSLNS